MITKSCELKVLVKGKPVTEYPRPNYNPNEIYVEGRSGSEFSIQVRNTTNKRVMAVLSVDGKSVIDGEIAGAESPGYVLNPYQTIEVKGWKVDSNTAAAFQFGGKKNSYSAQSGNGTQNCGVIGLMVWSEKEVPKYDPYPKFIKTHDSWPNSWPYGNGNDKYTLGDYVGGYDKFYSSPLRSFKGAVASTATLSTSSSTQAVAQNASMNNLGTEFGKATQFATTTTTFERGEIVEMVALYYDDAKGLKARGIVVERNNTTAYSTAPNPFPGLSGCTPPKGWTGR